MRYDPCEATYVTCEKAVSQRNHGTDGVHPGSHVRSEVVHSYQGNKDFHHVSVQVLLRHGLADRHRRRSFSNLRLCAVSSNRSHISGTGKAIFSQPKTISLVVSTL